MTVPTAEHGAVSGAAEAAALVLIVRDEADAIVEHLVYHLGVMGFDRALVYDNGSADATVQRVRRVSRRYHVELIDWPHRRTPTSSPQIAAYHDAIARLTADVDWVTMLDIDEYLHGTGGGRLPELLPAGQGAAQIALCWAVFGSSGHILAPRRLYPLHDEALLLPMAEAYQRRAPLNNPINRHCKVVVRPRQVWQVVNPHVCDVAGETVDASGAPVAWSEVPGVLAVDPPPVAFRINHYMTRSREHWQRRRRRGAFGAARTDADWVLHDRNDEHDVSAAHFYGDALADRMAELLAPVI